MKFEKSVKMCRFGTPMNPPTAQSAPMGAQSAPTAAPAADGEDPKGGYQPANPPMQGTPQPGAQVIFQAAPPPSQAYPAPAPLQNYPICKKGQYDNCRQRGG